mmetsp:Transcript_82011/g.227398  ORF Transcript_82011/g.227398 Transcript_82011/m.227398 type:complete len:292 (+) Transcript_82011:615-1490(+)
MASNASTTRVPRAWSLERLRRIRGAPSSAMDAAPHTRTSDRSAPAQATAEGFSEARSAPASSASSRAPELLGGAGKAWSMQPRTRAAACERPSPWPAPISEATAPRASELLTASKRAAMAAAAAPAASSCPATAASTHAPAAPGATRRTASARAAAKAERHKTCALPCGGAEACASSADRAVPAFPSARSNASRPRSWFGRGPSGDLQSSCKKASTNVPHGRTAAHVAAALRTSASAETRVSRRASTKEVSRNTLCPFSLRASSAKPAHEDPSCLLSSDRSASLIRGKRSS